MSYAFAKTDSNHTAIVDCLRKFGWRVKSVAAVPEFIDLIAQDDAGTYLIEVKRNAKEKLKPSQERLQRDGWVFYRLNSVDEAIVWSQAMRNTTTLQARAVQMR